MTSNDRYLGIEISAGRIRSRPSVSLRGLCTLLVVGAILAMSSPAPAQSPHSSSPDAWAKCPRVAGGLTTIERLNAEASASSELRALRDRTTMCAAYGRLIAASESLLAAAEETRAAIEDCTAPGIPESRKAQLSEMLLLQATMVSDNLHNMRAARAKNCPGK